MLRGRGASIALSLGTLYCQDFVTWGPAAPIRLPIWPGLITTLYVSTELNFSSPTIASGFPLPQTLAGFAVEMRRPASDPVLIPILHVKRASLCPDTAGLLQACGQVAAITVQIPWDVITDLVPYQIAVFQDGKRGKFVDANVSLRSLRFVTATDVALPHPGLFSGAAFVHTDGTAVSASVPAVSGEVITGFMFGLGRPSVSVVTGAASPADAELGRLTWENFSYVFRTTRRPLQQNALEDGEGSRLDVKWLGLTPGSAGLYQVNFEVPPVPVNLPLCESQGTGGIAGNMTVGFGSLTAVSICLAPAR